MNHFRLHQTVVSRLGRSGLVVLLVLAWCAFVMPGAAHAADCESSYTVQAGETLTQIAQQNGLSVDALAQANEIADANAIYANQSLCLTGVSANGSVRGAGDGFGRLNGAAAGPSVNANAGSATDDSQNLGSAQWVSEGSNDPNVNGPMVAGFGQRAQGGSGPSEDGPMATGFGQPSGDEGSNGPSVSGPMVAGFAQSARNSSGPGANGPMATGFGQPGGDDGSQDSGSVQWVTEETPDRPLVANGFGLVRNNADGPMASAAGFGQANGFNSQP
jgi:LysM repeat protein